MVCLLETPLYLNICSYVFIYVYLLRCSTFEEHHTMVFNILWEMVVSSNIDMKINAANLLKVIVSYIVMELMLPAILDMNL